MRIVLSNQEHQDAVSTKELVMAILASEGVDINEREMADGYGYKGISIFSDDQSNTVIDIEIAMVRDFITAYKKILVVIIKTGIQIAKAFEALDAAYTSFDLKWKRSSKPIFGAPVVTGVEIELDKKAVAPAKPRRSASAGK